MYEMQSKLKKYVRIVSNGEFCSLPIPLMGNRRDYIFITYIFVQTSVFTNIIYTNNIAVKKC